MTFSHMAVGQQLCARLTMFTHICNCRQWICTTILVQELSVRQSQSHSLEVKLHFTRNAFVSFPSQIRSNNSHAQFLFPSQIWANQRERIIFTKKFQLQNTIAVKWRMLNVALAKSKRGNVTVSFMATDNTTSASNGTSITPEKRSMGLACRNLIVADLLRQVNCSVLMGKIWTDTSPRFGGWLAVSFQIIFF